MTKKILYLTVIGTLLLFMVASAANINQMAAGKLSKTAPMKNSVILKGDEPLPSVPYAPIRYHLTASSPGDTVGWTQYDYQSNGSSGNRVALDNAGGVHFDWMNAPTLGVVRKVSYNYYTSGGGWGWPGVGTYAGNHTSGDGYCQIAVTSENRPTAAYHFAPTDNESTFVAIDVAPGIGTFDYYHPQIRFGTKYCIWPYITVDHSDRIHFIATETSDQGAEQTIGYMRSTNGGTDWSNPAIVDTTEDRATIITSSPVSDKVAIVYMNSLDTSSQWQNDVYYVQSTNGTTWDFRNGKHNVTGYGTDTDSLYAYTDLDAIYDYNDNLHIIWNAQLIDTATGGIYYSARLLHYSPTSGTITEITRFDSTWAESGCEFGGWNFTLAKMSLGVDASNGALFATYTSWNLGDCSTGGYANGDIFMNYSTDNGASWTLRGNLTNSQSPDCEAGDCDSDHWSSLAEHVDDHLHLFYVNDKDPGGAIQTYTTLTRTQSEPARYL
jgi:hypothetical protein